MPAPTFVAEYGDVWNTSTSPKTASVTLNTGEVLVVCGVTSDQGATLNTPTGGTGLTYTLQQSVVVSQFCTAYVWTTISASDQTYTLSLTNAGDNTLEWGFIGYRFSGSDGVGASSKTNVSGAAPSLSLTTLFANSAVVVINADWNAVDGTTRTWRTINSITPTLGNNLERTYFRDAAAYTTYSAYWNDVGATGAKTTGLSAPAGQKYSIIAVEVRGSSGAATTAPVLPKRPPLGALLQL